METEDFCTVICVDGVHLIRTPKGEILKGLIFTRVTDMANDIPTVIVKMMVNLENTVNSIK